MDSKKILVVDDDIEVGDLIELTLEGEDYSVIRADDGLMGLELARSKMPDLVILDVEMPRMDGLELCDMLRHDKYLHLVPIIMLTGSRTHPEDRITGLKIGADDYVLKPFLPDELLIRVSRLIKRTEEQLSVNPLSKLPGSYTLEAKVTERIKNRQPFAACYFDLDYFKAFNDYYGYKSGDEVIKLLASLISKAFTDCGNQNDILTHIGGDDFILVTTPEKSEVICDMVLKYFSEEIGRFYSHVDRDRGYITTVNRKGVEEKFPIMSLSIAIVSTDNKEIEHYAQMVDGLSELKKYAKSKQGSIVVKDRRNQ